jgi:signal transduction histidine kinase
MATKAGNAGKFCSGAALRAGSALLTSTSLALPASAQTNDFGLRLSILTREHAQPLIMDMSGPLGLIFIGLVILTTTTAVLHIVNRQRWARRLAAQDAEIGSLQASLQQAEIFMAGERHVVVSWGNASGEPDIEGDIGLIIGAGAPRRILGFTQWLEAADARRLEQAVERLKMKGEGFSLSADGIGGKRLEIDGRAVTGRAVMRIREVSGDRLERIKAEENYGRLAGEMGALHALLDAVPHQIWLRYPDGRLAWVNKAYAEAVDCRHPNEAISKGAELIDRPQRERIAIENADAPYRNRLTTIISGKRTMLDITDVRTAFGSGGIGVDAAETETLRIQLEAEMATHVRTLNELPIAVAMFDRKKQLRFNNAAYQKLWALDGEFLKTRPSDGEVLDSLRVDRKIPEQVDFRGWKLSLLEGYQKTETAEHLWHLPDGRILRVVANPTPDGGMNYVYDDMTERMTLETQFKALSRVQNETLNSLKEGVAVFGSDGKLKLANTAFSQIWQLHAETLLDNPHIDELIHRCPLAGDSPSWSALRGAITGLNDARHSLKARDTRADNSVIDCITSPLPDGATLVTFADVTANVNAERFLEEKNEALETAARVKNDFIQNVSYELRAPLQSVTMAAAMLADETMGSLNAKQKDYAESAKQSADVLLALMNDIFDLASLDAGGISLTLESVTPEQEVTAVCSALADQIEKSGVTLVTDIPADLGVFPADPQRVRQVLFHLVANAIGFSSAGQSISVQVRRDAELMSFTVTDQGRGIPADVQARIFERFESHTEGSSHRGVGLGLSMVKAFMDLHDGNVVLSSTPGQGTTVVCSFPLTRSQEPSTPGKQKAA